MSVNIENGFIARNCDVFDISKSLREDIKKVLQRKIVQLYVNTAYEAYDLLTANNGEYENIYIREHGELSPLQSAWSYTKLWVNDLFPEDIDTEILFFRIPDSNDLLLIVDGPGEAVKVAKSHAELSPYPCSDYDEGPKGKERLEIWERTVDFNQSLVSQALIVKVLGKQEKSIILLVSQKSLKEIGFRKPSTKTRLEWITDKVLPNDSTADRKRLFMERNAHLINPDTKFADIVASSK